MKTKKSKTEKIDVKKEFDQIKADIKLLDTKIDQVEERLEFKIDSKVDIAVDSMKAYTDVKFSQVQMSIDKLGQKLDVSVKGIVGLIERSIGNQAKIEDQVQEHEQRISLLETKIG